MESILPTSLEESHEFLQLSVWAGWHGWASCGGVSITGPLGVDSADLGKVNPLVDSGLSWSLVSPVSGFLDGLSKLFHGIGISVPCVLVCSKIV